MAEIKRVTLHPLKSDGSIDTSINLYPKTLTTGIVDEEGNQFDPQIKLVSGQTIKTVNGEDILGEGDIEIDAGSVHWGRVLGDINDQADLIEKLSDIEEDINNEVSRAQNKEAELETSINNISSTIGNVETDISNLQTSKQDVLVSGESIKTINGESILGAGNIEAVNKNYVDEAVEAKQDKLTAGSGINISEENIISAEIPDASWGSIEGDIEDQTDLANKLNKKSSIAGPFTPVWATQDFHFSLKPADKENIFNNAYDNIRILLNNAVTNATLINNTQTAKYYTITTPYGEEDLPTIYLYTIIKSGFEYVDSVDSVKLPNSNLASISDLLTPEAFDITNNVVRFNTNDVSKIISSKYDTLLVNNNGETVSFRLVTNESYSAAGLNIEEVLYTTTLWISDFEVVNINLSLIKKVNPQSATVEYEQTLVKTSVNADGMPKCFTVDNIQEQSAKEEVILNDYKFIFTDEKLYELNKSQTRIISGKTLVTKLYTNFNGSTDFPIWEVMTFVKDGDEATSLTISNVRLNIPVEDVKVNGSSVVVNKVAQITVPTKVSDLDNDSQFVDEEALANEALLRQNADTNLQEQIDAITVSSDVVDIVGTYQELLNYDTSKLAPNSVIKVLQDSTHSNAMSYYRWSNNQWNYIGSEGPFYTKSESDTTFQSKLISGTNIKTINNQSLLGSGNLITATRKSVTPTSINISMDPFAVTVALSQVDCADIFNNKYDFVTLLVESQLGVNITCARQADNSVVVGYFCQIDIEGEVYYYSFALTSTAVVDNVTKRIDDYHDDTKQDTLVSGTNIKTINNQSVLGAGNLNIEAGGGANLTPLEVPDDYLNLLEFINSAENPATYTISNENDVHIYVLKENGNDDLYIQKGSIISVYPGWSATILSADGQYTYFIDGDYLYGGVSINYEEVEAIVDEKLGNNVVMANTDQTISGQKKFTSSNGTIFENGGGTLFRYLYSSPAFKIIPDNNGNIDFYYSDTQLGRLYTGNAVLYSNVRPNLNESVNLGSSSYNWNNVYAKSLVSGQVTKNVSKLVTSDSNLIPESNNVYSLGNSGFQWGNLYLANGLRFDPQVSTKIENLKNLTVNTINLGGQIGSSTSWDSAKFLQYDTTSVKYKGKLYAGLDVNNQPIRNIPDTPDDGTSPINKNYADTNLQGKLTFDNAPTQNSTNPVTSGGVWSALDTIKKDAYIEVNITTYPTLADFLASSGEEGYMYLYPIDTSDLTKGYYRYIWENSAWINLGTTAIDLTNYVDLSSDQTIAGRKTFGSQILPSTNGTLNLGSASSKWQHLYLGGSIIWGSSYIQQQGTSIVINPSGNAVVANADNQKDLGASSRRWRNLFLAGRISDGNNTDYGLTLPDTTSFTANKEIATIDQITSITIERFI